MVCGVHPMTKSKTGRYLTFLGLGFYWAWVTVVFYSNVLLCAVSDSSPAINNIWLLATSVHLVVLLICVVFADQTTALLLKRWARMGCLAIMAISTALLAWGGLIFGAQAQTFEAIVIIGTGLAGITSAGALFMWALRFSGLDIRQVIVSSLLSFGTGLALYFLITLLPSIIGSAVTSLLPILSLLAFEIGGEDVPEHVSASRRPAIALRGSSISENATFLLIIFIYALCGEVLRAFSVNLTHADVSQMGALYLTGGLVGIAVFLIAVVHPRHGKYSGLVSLSMVRNVLIIMAAGFLIVPFLGNAAFGVVYGIFGAGFWCFRVITWVLCFLLILHYTFDPVRVVGLLDAAFALSVVVASPLDTMLLNSIQVGQTEVSTIAIMMVFILMCIAVFISNNRFIREAFAYYSDTPSMRASEELENAHLDMEAFSKRFSDYQLSARELDVALLLAHGRNLPFIQDELCISSGTAKTHVSHIYRKLGVHNRQEYLSLVEKLSYRPSDD